MSADINELTFRRHFEECGTVEAVRLVRDKNSGLGKGFGYVLFEVQELGDDRGSGVTNNNIGLHLYFAF